MNLPRPPISEFHHSVVRLLLPGLLALASSLSPVHARGAALPDSAVSLHKIEVGFQGLYKIGEWTPLWVTFQSVDDRQVTIVVETPDSDDNLTSLPSQPVDVKANTPVRFEACFRTGRLNGELHVRILDSEGQTLASRHLRATNSLHADLRPAVRFDRRLWVALGSAALLENPPLDDDSDRMAAFENLDPGLEPQLAHFATCDALPADWRAMQSVELLILLTAKQPDTGDSPLTQISPEHEALLRNWVRNGGHLLISIGSEAAAFPESPLAKLIEPIVVEKVDKPWVLRQSSTLEAFAGQHAPLTFSRPVPAARLARLPAANVIVRDPTSPQPLVASVAYGFGRVTVIAVDIDTPPLANWPALPAVLQKLARRSSASGKDAAPKLNRQLTHLGVTDLATQFQQTNEDFPEVRRPSYWWVMGLFLLYVAVIGPLDYLFVHRVLGRPELTWLSFPILVCVVAAWALWNANHANGRGLLVNQFNLVDIDSSSGALRGRTWVSLYSPEHRRYAVAVDPARTPTLSARLKPVPVASPQLSWVGAPENGVGGVYRLGAASFSGRSYRFAPSATAVENLPIAQWSTKSLEAAWHDDLSQPVVDCRLETFGAGQLNGSITHHFNTPMKDCLLVVNGWAYIPTTTEATLMPHVSWQPTGEGNVQQRDLRALLTGEKRVRRNNDESYSTEILATTETYNPLGRDRLQQVRMLSFHEAIGGTSYTGMANAALRELELTDLMNLGRGVLIGRIAAAASVLQVDGAAQSAGRETWVRLVLPVTQSDRTVDKFIPKASEKLPHLLPKTGDSP